jgi:hypothetical protein
MVTTHYSSIDHAQLRRDIELCAAHLSKRVATPAEEPFDSRLLAELGDRLSAALQKARENARRLVDAHHAEFPDSPLFCRCSLLRPLGQSRREVSVTQVLGWLLDPNADHGLGGLLLRAFLSVLTDESVAARGICNATDRSISVYTEFAINNANRADILIASPGNAVVIEAKIDANEGQAQTDRYRRDFGKSFPVCTYVYLTPSGTQAMSAGFTPIRYLELARALLRALPAGREAAGFHYARYFLAGVLEDLCEIHTSGKIDEVLQSNSFALETLLETQSHG